MNGRVVAVVVASLVAITTGIGSAAPSASQTYADPLGDATCCLDIGRVTVSNDADGLLTFRVELPNQPVAESARFVSVYINSDLDRVTGAGFPGLPLGRTRGADYRIGLRVDGDPASTLEQIATSVNSPVVVAAVDARYDHGWTVTVDRRALGGPAAFEFYVVGALYESDRPEVVDDAPDPVQGSWGWRYDTGLPPLVAPKPALTAAARPTLAPSSPRAGRTVTARLPFTLANASGVRASVRCSATVGGRAVRAIRAGAATNGQAVCSWTVPRSARGKLLRGSVTVTAGSATVVRRFTARVR